MERSADNLIWIDLEFTDLEPAVGTILQASMIVTTGALEPLTPPGIDSTVGGLLYDVAITQEQADNASEWVRTNQKQQLTRSLGEDAFPVDKVEELFIGYLLATCEVPENQVLRPMLSGNSVHGDYNYLKRHMPRLYQLLSFRLVDVSSIKELARRWCSKLVFAKNPETIKTSYPGEIEVKGEAHDALYDIKGSIAELAFYRKNLFVKSAH